MFKINDRVRLKYDNKENPALTVRSEVNGQSFLCISDCGQRMIWAITHELELVESNFDLKQAIREVLLSDQFVKTFAEAMSSKLQQASVSAEQPEQPVIKRSLITEPLDGWRFLEEGEVIRKGDRCFTRHSGSIDCLTTIGEKFNIELHYPTIRRNQFEVGEKVMHINGIHACEVVECDHEKDRYTITHNGSEYTYESKWLAPYIEEAK